MLFAQLNLEASNILLTISLATTAWVLKTVIQLKQDVAVMSTKIDDLPCNSGKGCNYNP